MNSAASIQIFSVLFVFLFIGNVCVNCQLVKNEKSEASPKLISLLETERQFLNMLKEYSNKVEKNLREIKSYISNISDIYNNPNTNYEEYLSHPINSYLLTRRTFLDANRIDSQIEEPQKFFKEFLNGYRSFNLLPSQETYVLAVNGLKSVQKTYNLNTESLANGYLRSNVFNKHPDVKAETLQAIDCEWLAYQYLEENNLHKYKEWSNMGSVLTQDQIFETDSKDGAKEEPVFVPKLLTNSLTFEEETEQYHRLCRGEKLLPSSVEKYLVCYNYVGKDPYFRLQPIKAEEASIDPYIVVFYDIITDEEIKSLQTLVKHSLKAALGVQGNGTSHLSAARISYTAFVPRSTNEITNHVAKKLESLTGLEVNDATDSSEEFQVNNYATGGLYVPHHDYFNVEGHADIIRTTGNRMATFMYYLSDVPAGGATVFPYAGVSVFPKKGAGVFWWNLKPNGDGDTFTKHAGCPVLYGTKWVNNVWIRSNAQMFKRPCHLDPDDVFSEL